MEHSASCPLIAIRTESVVGINRICRCGRALHLNSNRCPRSSVLSVDNMNASVSRCESLNGVAEPGRDLLETDVFDGTKSVRTKNRGNASRLETAVRALTNFLKLFGPRGGHRPRRHRHRHRSTVPACWPGHKQGLARPDWRVFPSGGRRDAAPGLYA